MFVFVAGVVAAIVVRIDTVPNWRKITKILLWIIGILLFKLLLWGLYSNYKKEAVIKTQIFKTEPVVTTVPARQITKYNFYWELPGNQYINGRNRAKENETVLELVSDGDPNSLYFDFHYTQSGRPQTCRLRLKKIRNGAWSGTFGQEDPEEHGTIELREIVPDTYSGTMTWENGMVGMCSVSKIK
jgi:hypothetical protein